MANTFQKTEIGMCLEKACVEVGSATIVSLYLDDYVQMVYRTVTDNKPDEYEVKE